jgi:predicted metal-binding protein
MPENIAATAPTTVLVCMTCRPAGEPVGSAPRGPELARAASSAAGTSADVRVLRVRCLANCSRGLSAALRREGTWTYVFGHLDADRDGAALIEGARLLGTSADGLLPWRGRPEALKRGLIARIPPADFQGDELEDPLPG